MAIRYYGIERKRYNLDVGQIWTGQSPYIEHYKAIEGQLNPRTNKPFKFDSIWMEEGWQDDPVWQAWNWTNVKEVSFENKAVNATHAKLPLTRLNGLKKINFENLKTNGGYAIALEVLKQNPELEILRVDYDPPMPSQLAQTVCSLKQLKELEVLKSKDLVEEVLTCLPADNHLKKLHISPDGNWEHDAVKRIVATPEIIAKLRLDQLACVGCEFGWTDLSGLERLTWQFNDNHNETVRVLEKLIRMNFISRKPLHYLHLIHLSSNFSQHELILIRMLAALVDKLSVLKAF